MKSLKRYLGIGLVLLMALPVGVQATLTAGVTTNYGAYAGSSVTYSNVGESTTYGAYNAPTIGGDGLSFTPLGLKAESTGGFYVHPAGIPIFAPCVNDAQLQFHVHANDGQYIERLDFAEGGDLTVTGTGTADTYADVSANFWVKIYEVDGDESVFVEKTFSINDFHPHADGMHDLTDGSASALIWNGSIQIDLKQMLIDEGISFDYGVTHASVNLDNWLEADSEATSSALIQKKDAGAFSITAIVPEPASLVLILGTTSLFTFIRRRFIG